MAKAAYVCIAALSLCISVRASIVDTAQQYTHVRERTGHNDGRQIAMFLSSVNIKHPAPWCAAFANYVLQKAAVNHKMSGLAASCCPKNSKLIFSKGKIKMVQAPMPGDLFFWFRPGGGHTGFIKEWPDHGEYFTTIEGNVTCADGRQGVAVKTRKKENVQKIYAASMLYTFAGSAEPEQPAKKTDSVSGTTNPSAHTQPLPPASPNPVAPTPPYIIILIVIIIAAEANKSNHKK